MLTFDFLRDAKFFFIEGHNGSVLGSFINVTALSVTVFAKFMQNVNISHNFIFKGPFGNINIKFCPK
jgi:hypothetical protein